MSNHNAEIHYKITDAESYWEIKYHNKLDYTLMQIAKLNWQGFSFMPFLQLGKNGQYWVIYMDYENDHRKPYDRIIRRVNLVNLSNIIDKFPSNIGINIIKYMDPKQPDDDIIYVDQHRVLSRGSRLQISPNNKLLYIHLYDGYQSGIVLYSLITFKKLEYPNIWFTNISFEDIKFSDNEDTLTCTYKQAFYTSINKWGFPDYNYDIFYIRDYIPLGHDIHHTAENIIKGLTKPKIKKDYYTKDDIEYLWTDIDEVENEQRIVETYKFIYNDLTDELIIEHYKDEDFFDIFPDSWSFNY